MPGIGQWRDASAYDYIKDLDPAALAWEFLRRNLDYQQEYNSLIQRDQGDQHALAAFAAHWGLRFCPGPGHARQARRHPLEPASGPRDNPPPALPFSRSKSPHQ